MFLAEIRCTPAQPFPAAGRRGTRRCKTEFSKLIIYSFIDFKLFELGRFDKETCSFSESN